MTATRLARLNAAEKTMPTVDGAIVRPDFVPENRRPEYLERLRAWCRANARELWPKWLQTYIDLERSRRGSAGRSLP